MSEVEESYLHHLRGLFESSGDAFHEKIYDFFPGIIYVYSTDSKKLRYVNKKITDLLGFSYEDIKTWDNDFDKIIFKEDLELVRRELEKFKDLKDEDSHSYRCRFNKKEGDWLHFNVHGKVLRRDENGKVNSLLLVAQDIDLETRSGADLVVIRELAADNEELLQFGNWLWNPATNIVKWSRGMYVLMDYNPEVQSPEITLDSYLARMNDQDRKRFSDTLDQALKYKDTSVEFKYSIKTVTGGEKIFYSKGKVIFDDAGNIKHVVGITRDITEPTRLYDNLDNYRTMVMEKEDFLGHGSWEYDISSDLVIWSDGMFRIFGYDPEKDKPNVILNSALYNKHMTPDSRTTGLKEMEHRLNSRSNYVWNYDIVTNSGENKKLESFGKIVRDDNGKVARIIGTTRDITMIRKYERELEQKITELDRSNRELEDFAYAASHDLQEPLRKIATLSDRLQAKFGEVLLEDGKKYIERIQLSVRSARFLIDSLMEFSRISQESHSFAATDLNTIINEIKGDLELKIEETQAIINSDALPTIEISPLQIKQLFSNILLNSIKFRKGDVLPVINITSRQATVAELQSWHLSPAVNHYVITIEDNGIGFEHEYEQKIFQMFHRLHGKSEYPGAGIGLALCKKIVEHHKGFIFAKATPDVGATFTIVLPEKHS